MVIFDALLNEVEHIYMHTCMHAYIHTYIHTHIHIYIYVCVYIYIDIVPDMQSLGTSFFHMFGFSHLEHPETPRIPQT